MTSAMQGHLLTQPICKESLKPINNQLMIDFTYHK